MNRVLLNQVYWPTDTEEQRSGKWQRLCQAVLTVVFGSDKAWEVSIRRYARKRSVPANNYLWGVAYTLMSDESGYEKEELHEIMCGKYFGTKVVTVLGVSKRVPNRSTTTNEEGDEDVLGTADFAEFVDFVIREAAVHMDLAIPPPTTEQVPRA